MARSSGHKLNINDSTAFLNLLKTTLFQEEREKYEEFLNVMNAFKARRIDIVRAREWVEKLFGGHPNLLLGFDTFLPTGYKIIAPTSRIRAEFEVGREFARKVQERFQNNLSVYPSFREIVDKCKRGNTLITHVQDEIATLFQVHEDLLHEFTCFSPYIIKSILVSKMLEIADLLNSVETSVEASADVQIAQ